MGASKVAIYNPKRALELQAAARLAESQRQRELAKAQREQRTTEQILGLVEDLIGAAPQVVGGLQDIQAQQVLAGEKPLPEQKPKSDDILENIGRFITDPFDAGVRQRVTQMAQEQKGARLQAAEPLLREAIQKPGVKQPAKFKGEPEVLGAPYADFGAVKEPGVPYAMEPEVKFTPREAAMKQLMRDPALAMLPEREREAAIAGLQQRMTAEQAAAEREAKKAQMEEKLFGLKEKELKLKISEQEAKKSEKDIKPENVNVVADAIYNNISSFAISNSDDLNSTDEGVRSAAFDKLRNEAETFLQLNLRDSSGRQIPVNSPLAQAAVARSMATAMKDVAKDKLQPQIIQDIANEANAISSLIELDAERNLVQFSPKEKQVIEQLLVENVNLPLNMDDIARAYAAANLRLDPAQDSNKFAWLNKAQKLRQRLVTAEYKGTGSIAVQERQAIAPYVLTPWLSEEQWDVQFRSQLRDMAKKYSTTTRALAEAYQVPSEQLKEADMIAKYYNPSTEKDALREAKARAPMSKDSTLQSVISQTPYVQQPSPLVPPSPVGDVSPEKQAQDIIAGATEKAIVQPLEAAGRAIVKGGERILSAFGGDNDKLTLAVGSGVKAPFAIGQLKQMYKDDPEMFALLISQNPAYAKTLKQISGE